MPLASTQWVRYASLTCLMTQALNLHHTLVARYGLRADFLPGI